MTFDLVGNGGNCDECQWIAAQGDITSSTPGRLREFLSDNHAGLIVFNSPGGEVIPSLELGTIIRESGASTSIGKTLRSPDGWHYRESGTCQSSCAFAFLGGASRSLNAGELGVHQFYDMVAVTRPSDPIYSALDLSEAQIVSSLLIAYAFEMDVDPRVIAKASSIPPQDMHFLSEEEIALWRVRYDPWILADWKIRPRFGGIEAFAATPDGNIQASFFCVQGDDAYLSIARTVDYPSGTYTDPVPYIEDMSVFGFPVSPAQMSALYHDDLFLLVVALPGYQIGFLPDDEILRTEARVARAYQGLLEYEMRGQGARETIDIALRYCSEPLLP